MKCLNNGCFRMLLCGGLGLLWGMTAYGQARAAADRTAEISVFGGGSFYKPDYGLAGQPAYDFGADLTWFLHRSYLAPSLELRGVVSPKGTSVGENTYSAGLKVQHRYGRVVPYADFLMGAGTIKFTNPQYQYGRGYYTSDNSKVYSFGGGVDVDIAWHFSAKGDFQYSHWDTGGNVTYTPVAYTGGVVYHIPFGDRYSSK